MATNREDIKIESAEGLFFRQERDEPLTTSQMDTNFIFIDKVLNALFMGQLLTFKGGDENNDGELQYSELKFEVDYQNVLDRLSALMDYDAVAANLNPDIVLGGNDTDRKRAAGEKLSYLITMGLGGLGNAIRTQSFILPRTQQQFENKDFPYALANGSMGFDTTTKKTLTLESNKWYDAMGNVVYTCV